ncbi:glycerate kinase [Thermopolyspora sp. NPDC052614]|uniref:glycerate kinase n=1 Tax=Thermopolyspora sp. NPDC052614 TaxID=3155682 RepID=UPI0034255403
MSGHIVIASDKFKGSLTAAEVAARLTAGLGDRACVVSLPVADGGDGTVDAVVACGFTRVEAEVTGPTGELVTAAYAWRPDDGPAGSGPTAVIELAEASGLRRLSAGKAALTATSHGTGQLIAHALRRGARRIVLGLGGSACTDGGAGMLQALGARLLDDQGRDLPPGGAALRRLARIDLSGFLSAALVGPGSSGPGVSGLGSSGPASSGTARGRDPEGTAATPLADVGLTDVEFVVAGDVDNPLLGPHGAAAVYGPQKGASHADVAILEAGLTRFARISAEVLGEPSADHEVPDVPADDRISAAREAPGPADGGERATAAREAPRPADGGERGTAAPGRTPRPAPPPYADRPGAGAAGGVGFAAMAFLGATIRPGITYLLDLLRFDDHLERARLVITGEGSLDAQSLRGKAPVGVAEAAGRRGIPVIAVCGRRALTDEQLHAAGIRSAYALTDLEPDPAACMAHAGPLLERLAVRIAAAEPEFRERPA